MEYCQGLLEAFSQNYHLISGSSAILVVFLILTLSVFLALRIFDASRIIHMNLEIALLMAHFCLLLTSDLVWKLAQFMA